MLHRGCAGRIASIAAIDPQTSNASTPMAHPRRRRKSFRKINAPNLLVFRFARPLHPLPINKVCHKPRRRGQLNAQQNSPLPHINRIFPNEANHLPAQKARLAHFHTISSSAASPLFNPAPIISKNRPCILASRFFDPEMPGKDLNICHRNLARKDTVHYPARKRDHVPARSG